MVLRTARPLWVGSRRLRLNAQRSAFRPHMERYIRTNCRWRLHRFNEFRQRLFPEPPISPVFLSLGWLQIQPSFAGKEALSEPMTITRFCMEQRKILTIAKVAVQPQMANSHLL